MIEDLQCALESFASGTFLPIAPKDVAEDDERAGALKGLLEPVVEREGALELLGGGAEVAAGSGQKGAATAGHDEHPGRRLELVEPGEQRFDAVPLASAIFASIASP